MGSYRRTRNIESSIIQFLEDNVNNNWGNVVVEKTFTRVYGIPFSEKEKTACICVRVGTTEHENVEIGGNSTRREVQVLLDIFASNDGQRLDLKDYIIEKIKSGLPYYEYTVSNGQIASKTQNGRIKVLDIDDSPLNFDVEKSSLDVHDRYRHLLTLTVRIGQVEI